MKSVFPLLPSQYQMAGKLFDITPCLTIKKKEENLICLGCDLQVEKRDNIFGLCKSCFLSILSIKQIGHFYEANLILGNIKSGYENEN